MPDVFIKILSALPFSTTLVSPVTIFKPISSRTFFVENNIFLKSETGKPSSRINERLIAAGVHPVVTRSFTVPHMLSFPISPPGKNIGFTTKLSVV
ncbi:hypothetical protein ES708_17747 [subsurface metagenome]